MNYLYWYLFINSLKYKILKKKKKIKLGKENFRRRINNRKN